MNITSWLGIFNVPDGKERGKRLLSASASFLSVALQL